MYRGLHESDLTPLLTDLAPLDVIKPTEYSPMNSVYLNHKLRIVVNRYQIFPLGGIFMQSFNKSWFVSVLLVIGLTLLSSSGLDAAWDEDADWTTADDMNLNQEVASVASQARPGGIGH